jgi:hypothetical protein
MMSLVQMLPVHVYSKSETRMMFHLQPSTQNLSHGLNDPTFLPKMILTE